MLAKLAPTSQGDCNLLDVPFRLLSTTVRTLLPSHPLSMPSITSGSTENSGYTDCSHQVLGAEEYGEDRQEIKTKAEASTWHTLG